MINQNKYGRINILKLFAPIAIVLFGCTLTIAASGHEHDLMDGHMVLTVNVINGTPNGKPVSGDEAVVDIVQHGELVDTLRKTVDSNGKIVFDDIPSQGHLVAYAKVLHEGMSFGGHGIELKPKQQNTTHVEVFDVSFDTSQLSATTHHLKIRQKGNSLVLSEFIQLRNPSNFAITSKEKDNQDRTVVLTIPLPKGFKDFSCSGYLVPEALVFTEEGFYDTMAVPPGDHKLIFSYNLEAKSSDMDILRKMSLSTDGFIVFSQLGAESIHGLGKPDGNVVLSDGIAAEYYDQGLVQAGAQIAFKVAGLSVNKGSRNSWLIIAVVFGVLTILALTRLLPAKNHEQPITK